MTERKRLTKLLKEAFILADDNYGMPNVSQVTNYLFKNGVIIPPCKVVWYIVNRNTEFECVMSANIENLPLYIIKNLDKYEYYECKEEAEKALKERKIK